MLRKITVFVPCAILCVALLFGCSSNSNKAQEIVNDAVENAESDAADEQSASDMEEMPEFTFDFDESSYLIETYALETADNLDLINYDQLLWLAARDRKATIVIADPSSKDSAEIIAAAQNYAQTNPVDIYIFEPDGSEENLLEDLQHAGLTNLESVETDEIIVLTSSKLSSDGLTAVDIAHTSDEVVELLKTHYELACCG